MRYDLGDQYDIGNSPLCIAEAIEVPLGQKVPQSENIYFIICFHNKLAKL